MLTLLAYNLELVAHSRTILAHRPKISLKAELSARRIPNVDA